VEFWTVEDTRLYPEHGNVWYQKRSFDSEVDEGWRH